MQQLSAQASNPFPRCVTLNKSLAFPAPVFAQLEKERGLMQQ